MHEVTESKRRRTLLTVFSIVFLDQLGFGLIIPVLAPLVFDSSGSLFNASFDLAYRARIIGFLIATYPLMQFFGAPLLGALSDRLGRKPVLLMSVAGTSIGYLLFGLGVLWGKLWLLFLARGLDGFTGGNISTANSAVADISDQRTKSRNFGIVHAAYGLGFILGPYTGGKLSDPSVLEWFTLTTPFWVAAAVTVANLLLVSLVFRETIREKISTTLSPLSGLHNVRKAFAMPNTRSMFVVVFLLWCGFNSFTQFFQVYLIEYFAVTQRAIGHLFAYVGVWLVVGLAVVNRWVSKRFSSRDIVLFALPVLAFVVFLHLMPREFWMYYALLPFLAVTMGLIIPNSTAIISGLADERSQGEIIGIQQSMLALAMVFPPIVSGYLVSWHVSLPVAIAAGLIGIAWMVYLLWFERAPHQVFHEQ